VSAPRVLVLGTVLGQPLGGVRRHNAELLPRAAELLRREGGSLVLFEGRPPAPVDLLPNVERVPSTVPAGPPLRRALWEGRAVARALERARSAGVPFDLVHTAHLPPPAAGRLASLPLAVTLHDLRHLDPRLSGLLRRAAAERSYGAIARRAARIVFVSRTVAAQFERRFPAARGRTAVVPNAADHLRAPPSGTPPPRGLEAGYLLHLGHLERRKNLDALLRGLHAAPQWPPLVLAGVAKGAELARLIRLAAELGVGGRVRFLGAATEDELAPLLIHASCVVLPSWLEGFGLVAAEAQALGVPLAVSRAGALTEVAAADTPSFEPQDVPGLVSAVCTALARGRREPRVVGSWDASAESLVRAWCEASGRR
jgi:glycosyltransferase involved in cell wall biosynthesis